MSGKQPIYDSPFQTAGYFATVMNKLTGRTLGDILDVTPEPDRVIGFNGMKDEVWTKNVELTKGHRKVLIRASEKKPLKVQTIIFIKSGRMNWKHPQQ